MRHGRPGTGVSWGGAFSFRARNLLVAIPCALWLTGVLAVPFHLQQTSVRAPREITLEVGSNVVALYDFTEVTLHVRTPVVGNPFTDVVVTATLTEPGNEPVTVLGFCDADDGSVFRVRFLARKVGENVYVIRYSVPAEGLQWTLSGSFEAVASARKGLVRVDPDHPFHFLWDGTGEHFFYTGATAYHLLSWTDDNKMVELANRIADAGANRVRFLNYGRASDDEWSEGMVQNDAFVWSLSPWPAVYPERQLRDGSMQPNHSRFNLAHWRKAELLLRTLRDRDVVAAVNMYMDRGATDAPPAGSSAEALYFRYAVARYGAFSNVMWDLGTEHDEYRSAAWANTMGTLMHQWDPYDHLVSAHTNQFRPQYETQAWYDFAEFQYYGVNEDSHGDDYFERVNHHIRHWRDQVRDNGRIIPQVNEEYGYELDPSGYDEPLSRVRKKAWAIVMGGGYVTSGERKAWQHGDPTNGGSHEPDTQILHWAKRMRDFFDARAIPYWNMEPMSELDGTGAYGLGLAGESSVIFLPDGGSVSLALPPGEFAAEWFRPKTGESIPLPGTARGAWGSPSAPAPALGEDEDGDWVLYLKKTNMRSAEFGASASLLPFDSTAGAGWLSGSSSLLARTRACASADPRQAGFVFTLGARTWEMRVANGDYDVTVSVGDCQHLQGPQRVRVEDVRFVENETTPSGGFLVRTKRVRVLDGRLSVTIGGGGGNTALNYVEVVPAAVQPELVESINFQSAAAPIPPGFTADHGEPFSAITGRGWSEDLRGRTRSRGVNPDSVLDSLVFAGGRPAVYELPVAPGSYDVQIAAGDLCCAQGPHRIVVEGVPVVNGETTAASSHLVRTTRARVLDGSLTMEIGGTNGTTVVNYLSVASASTTSIAVDFLPATSPVPPGYAPDSGAPYSFERGYGWTHNTPAGARARSRATDPALDTFVYVGPAGAAWSVDLPNGPYRVTVAVGDAAAAQGPQRVVADGLALVNGETTAPGEFLVRDGCVSVTNERLSLDVGGLAGNTAINWVRVVTDDCGGAGAVERAAELLP